MNSGANPPEPEIKLLVIETRPRSSADPEKSSLLLRAKMRTSA